MSRAWLAPLAAGFAGAAALRVALYRRGWLPSRALRGPVISVGNLSLGGSGKTPLVALVAGMAREQGLPVAVLSRGYRGAFRGEALLVSDGERPLASAAQAGDEPAMLAARLPGVVVAVGRHRDAVGRAVEARFGPRLHLLDDGFQHLRLRRDLDLLCLDPLDLDDRPLPAGRLREPPRAARRADALFVVGVGPEAFEELRQRQGLLRERPCFRLERAVTRFCDAAGEARAAPLRPYLLSGIGRPERFAADAAGAAGAPLGHARFPDHHPFTAAELAEAGREAERAGADALLTTAKDRTRIASPPDGPPLVVMEIEARLDDAGWLRERIAELGRTRLAGAA